MVFCVYIFHVSGSSGKTLIDRRLDPTLHVSLFTTVFLFIWLSLLGLKLSVLVTISPSNCMAKKMLQNQLDFKLVNTFSKFKSTKLSV